MAAMAIAGGAPIAAAQAGRSVSSPIFGTLVLRPNIRQANEPEQEVKVIPLCGNEIKNEQLFQVYHQYAGIIGKMAGLMLEAGLILPNSLPNSLHKDLTNGEFKKYPFGEN